MRYHVYKISNILCIVMIAYHLFQNNVPEAIYFAVMGFYSDWLAEKEK